MQEQLASAERDRDRQHLMGYVDAGSDVGRRLLVIVVVALIVVILLVLFGSVGPDPIEGLEIPSGTVTHEVTRVQAPSWWSPAP